MTIVNANVWDRPCGCTGGSWENPCGIHQSSGGPGMSEADRDKALEEARQKELQRRERDRKYARWTTAIVDEITTEVYRYDIDPAKDNGRADRILLRLAEYVEGLNGREKLFDWETGSWKSSE